jgi:THO complex subunit 3
MTGESSHHIKCLAATNTVSWHPKNYVLAFACDETDKNGRDEGNIRIIGILN